MIHLLILQEWELCLFRKTLIVAKFQTNNKMMIKSSLQ